VIVFEDLIVIVANPLGATIGDKEREAAAFE